MSAGYGCMLPKSLHRSLLDDCSGGPDTDDQKAHIIARGRPVHASTGRDVLSMYSCLVMLLSSPCCKRVIFHEPSETVSRRSVQCAAYFKTLPHLRLTSILISWYGTSSCRYSALCGTYLQSARGIASRGVMQSSQSSAPPSDAPRNWWERTALEGTMHAPDEWLRLSVVNQ